MGCAAHYQGRDRGLWNVGNDKIGGPRWVTSTEIAFEEQIDLAAKRSDFKGFKTGVDPPGRWQSALIVSPSLGALPIRGNEPQRHLRDRLGSSSGSPGGKALNGLGSPPSSSGRASSPASRPVMCAGIQVPSNGARDPVAFGHASGGVVFQPTRRCSS